MNTSTSLLFLRVNPRAKVVLHNPQDCPDSFESNGTLFLFNVKINEVMDMVRKYDDGRPSLGKLNSLIGELNKLLKINNKFSKNGKKEVGKETLHKRRNIIEKFLRMIHSKGYTIQKLSSIKPFHFELMFDVWLDEGKAAPTIQNEICYLKQLCSWINKPGLLDNTLLTYARQDELLQRKERIYVADTEKSWTQMGIDPDTKIAEVYDDEPIVAMQLMLMWKFGCRAQEAMLFRPDLGDNGKTISVLWGTKGNRPRNGIPVHDPMQRQLLDMIKSYTNGGSGSTIPKNKSLKKWRGYFYKVLARHGITKKSGITSHGLRHEYTNNRYEALILELTGIAYKAPLRRSANDPIPSDDIDTRVRTLISEELGHVRLAITNVYLGSGKNNKADKADT